MAIYKKVYVKLIFEDKCSIDIAGKSQSTLTGILFLELNLRNVNSGPLSFQYKRDTYKVCWKHRYCFADHSHLSHCHFDPHSLLCQPFGLGKKHLLPMNRKNKQFSCQKNTALLTGLLEYLLQPEQLSLKISKLNHSSVLIVNFGKA